MKFNIAAAAIAATSSFVGVRASSSTSSSSSSTSKSGKGSCSSSPKLEKFCNEAPADFSGTYDLCYQSVIRNAVGGPTGSIHQCFDKTLGQAYDRVFTALDGYGAYEAIINHDFLPVLPGIETLKFQGIAVGNSIRMTTYGGGFSDENGDIVLPNETPDTQECTRYEDGILKCMMYFEEYCGPNTADATIPIDCQVGEWLMSYTIEVVLVLEEFECPEPPKGFCESNQPDFGPGRKLQEEEEENEVSPCPFLNKMN